MPYKDKNKKRDYQRKFMVSYRKKEREMIREYKKQMGLTDGRKKKQ
jgi:hypothetical protein